MRKSGSKLKKIKHACIVSGAGGDRCVTSRRSSAKRMLTTIRWRLRPRAADLKSPCLSAAEPPQDFRPKAELES
jgi:hypothetical protein